MMADRRTYGLILGLVGAAGCWPVYRDPQGASSEGSDGSASEVGAAPTTTGSGPGGTTGIGGPGGTGTTETVEPASTGGSSTQGSSGGETGGTFIVRSDDGVGQIECDTWTEDCPPGQKCTFYAAGGGTSWNATKCIPVMEDPAQPGEPCFVVGNGVSGIDNCDLHAYCWDTNKENIGVCVAMCMGEPGTFSCDPGYSCTIAQAGIPNLCFSSCDPLLQDCSMEDDLCIGNPSGDGFTCVLDASGVEGQAHDPCEYANACDPGLICLNPAAAVECDQDASGCCEPFCDLTKPNMCPGQGQVCNPYYEMGTAPPGMEHYGYCSVPV